VKQEGVAQHFSRVASFYEQHASIQQHVAETLSTYFPEKDSVSKILEVGCGTGFLTRILLSEFTHATIKAVDFSSAMLELAKESVCGNGRVSWSRADVREGAEKDCYDLVVSSSALHWMEPIGETLASLYKVLHPNAFLVMSVMLEGTLGELRSVREEVVPEKKPHSQLPSSETLRTLVSEAGFTIEQSMISYYQETYPSGHALLQTIRQLGFTGGEVSRADAPLTRTELQKVVSQYEANYALPNGRVPATFRVGYYVARTTI